MVDQRSGTGWKGRRGAQGKHLLDLPEKRIIALVRELDWELRQMGDARVRDEIQHDIEDFLRRTAEYLRSVRLRIETKGFRTDGDDSETDDERRDGSA